MPSKHAVLSASSSYRWLACPPSAQECAKLPDTPSEFALQGTDAHSLCEYKVLSALGRDAADPTKGLTFFDEEMAECTDEYAQYVMEQVEAAKTVCRDPLVVKNNIVYILCKDILYTLCKHIVYKFLLIEALIFLLNEDRCESDKPVSSGILAYLRQSSR